jgi:hypothetical protein
MNRQKYCVFIVPKSYKHIKGGGCVFVRGGFCVWNREVEDIAIAEEDCYHFYELRSFATLMCELLNESKAFEGEGKIDNFVDSARLEFMKALEGNGI